MKKLIAILLLLPMLLAAVGTCNAAENLFSGGAGTEADPYRISTAADLRQLSRLTQDSEGGRTYSMCYFLMTADIDLENKVFNAMFPATGFRGVFDGDRHTISGLKIDCKESSSTGAAVHYQGLFSSGSDAVIKNLTISHSTLNVDTKAGCIGSIMGSGRNCSFEYCNVTDSVTISSNYKAGGIVGNAAHGTITGCTNAASITTSGTVSTAGGIAGYSSAVIANCSNSGAITSEYDAGGIAATQRASINDCGNDGTIFARNGQAGGITVSFGDGALNDRENDESVAIVRCTNHGSVTSEKRDAAGITARASTGSIQNCGNLGDIRANSCAGGILAIFQESPFGKPCSQFTLESCTNFGSVSNTEPGLSNRVGGICAWLSSACTDVVICGCVNSGELTGMYTAGGIVSGFQGIRLEITDCSNIGNASGNEVCGGILASASSSAKQTVCELTITGCMNAGDLYAGLITDFANVAKPCYVGGIVGRTWSLPGEPDVTLTISDCTSSGKLDCEGKPVSKTDPLCAAQDKPD